MDRGQEEGCREEMRERDWHEKRFYRKEDQGRKDFLIERIASDLGRKIRREFIP